MHSQGRMCSWTCKEQQASNRESLITFVMWVDICTSPKTCSCDDPAIKFHRESESDRDRQTKTDRDRETETDRQTDRDRDRQKQKQRQRGKQRDRVRGLAKSVGEHVLRVGKDASSTA